MFTPVTQHKYAPIVAKRLIDRLDDEGVPVLQFSDDVDHPSHVELPKARYRWGLFEGFIRVTQSNDLCCPLICPFNSEKLWAEEPVQEPRKSVFAFWRRRQSESKLGANFEHKL